MCSDYSRLAIKRIEQTNKLEIPCIWWAKPNVEKLEFQVKDFNPDQKIGRESGGKTTILELLHSSFLFFDLQFR